MPYISRVVGRSIKLNWKILLPQHMGVGQFAAHPLSEETYSHETQP